jgi:hypothetical protein
MTFLAFDEIFNMRRCKSRPLSIAATSLLAMSSSAFAMGMSLNEDLVRRR